MSGRRSILKLTPKGASPAITFFTSGGTAWVTSKPSTGITKRACLPSITALLNLLGRLAIIRFALSSTNLSSAVIFVSVASLATGACVR